MSEQKLKDMLADLHAKSEAKATQVEKSKIDAEAAEKAAAEEKRTELGVFRTTVSAIVDDVVKPVFALVSGGTYNPKVSESSEVFRAEEGSGTLVIQFSFTPHQGAKELNVRRSCKIQVVRLDDMKKIGIWSMMTTESGYTRKMLGAPFSPLELTRDKLAQLIMEGPMTEIEKALE